MNKCKHELRFLRQDESACEFECVKCNRDVIVSNNGEEFWQ